MSNKKCSDLRLYTSRLNLQHVVQRSCLKLGGQLGGSPYSNHVLQFDFNTPGQGWTSLESSMKGCSTHGCTVGTYQGNEAIFVTGESGEGQNQVEFFVDAAQKRDDILATIYQNQASAHIFNRRRNPAQPIWDSRTFQLWQNRRRPAFFTIII